MAIDWLVIKHQLQSLVLNTAAWVFAVLRCFLPKSFFRPPTFDPNNCCVVIPAPGGTDNLILQTLTQDRATIGYNMRHVCPPSITHPLKLESLPADCVVIRTRYASVNFADIAIRWGLYESALRYVGWPIVPGFDFSGEVEFAGSEADGLKKGDKVFGCTLFGAYSTRVVVPASQIRTIPPQLSFAEAAALPAVAATALHSLHLAGFYPSQPLTENSSVLIHSAAGGVGSMLIQMSKILGVKKIVAVVGSAHKTELCLKLGADFVVDKSKGKLWEEVEKICPEGFAAVFDANGVETLSASFAHLAMCGRLVVYGFHTNLPKSSYLAPWHWIKLAIGQSKMPHFDPMQLTLESKSVLGFNLSFFAEEKKIIAMYLAQLIDWVAAGKLKVASVTEFEMSRVGEAHLAIQSGQSVGKLVLKTCPH